MKDYSLIEQKINALVEELQTLKEADDDVEVEDKTEEETVDITPVEDGASTEVEETEVAVDDETAALLDNVGKNLLNSFMQSLDDVNMLIEQFHDDGVNEVLAEVRDNTNGIIGKLQAILSVQNNDAEAQAEAREEAEEKIEGSAPSDFAGEDVKDVEEKEDVEVIEPLDGEVEEVEDEEEEKEEKETEKESLDTKSSEKKLDEDLQITIGFSDYEPWSGAVDTYEYILDQYGHDMYAVERVLEDVFPDGCTDTELNDFFWFGDPEIYDIFGVKNPYAEDDDDDEVEDEEEEIDFEDDEVEENYDDISEDEIGGDIDEATSPRKLHRR